MDITTTKSGDVIVVALTGELDGSSAPVAQAEIVPLAAAQSHIVLDMGGIGYMSSAGLRMLLIIYRTIAGRGGKVVLTGLSEDLKDTMSLTGFLDFFDHYDTQEAGIAALKG